MKKFLKDETGATAIEYALIALATCMALIATMPTIAANLQPAYSTLANNVGI